MDVNIILSARLGPRPTSHTQSITGYSRIIPEARQGLCHVISIAHINCKLDLENYFDTSRSGSVLSKTLSWSRDQTNTRHSAIGILTWVIRRSTAWWQLITIKEPTRDTISPRRMKSAIISTGFPRVSTDKRVSYLTSYGDDVTGCYLLHIYSGQRHIAPENVISVEQSAIFSN